MSLNGAQRDELLQHIRSGMRPGAAAEVLGFSRSAIYELIDDDEDFAAEIEKAEREATEHVEEALYQAAISGNVTAGRIWLERRDGRRSKDLVPLNNPDDNPGFDSELAELNKLAAGES